MRPLAVLLLVASIAPAQVDATPEISGADTVAYLAEFKAKGVPQTTGIRWSVSPKPAGLTMRRVASERVMLIAGPPGEYEITMEMFTAKLDGKGGLDVIVELGEITKRFRITGGVPVPPGPGPGPIPPPPPPPVPDPVDPLVVSIQAAAVEDSWPATALASYGRGFAALASREPTAATVGDLANDQLATLRKALGAGVQVPANVRRVVKRELDAVLPPSAPNRPLTDTERAAVQKCYARLAAALERASK